MLDFDYDLEDLLFSGPKFIENRVTHFAGAEKKKTDPVTKSIVQNINVDQGDTSTRKLNPVIFEEEEVEKPFPLEEDNYIEIYSSLKGFKREKPLSGVVTSKDSSNIQVAFFRVSSLKDSRKNEKKLVGKLIQIPLNSLNFISTKKVKNLDNLYQFYINDKKIYDYLKKQVSHYK